MRFGNRSPRFYFASPPTPVFGADDRVAGGGGGSDGLPPELVGKSPAEIARYYQSREAILRAELSVPPPNNPPPNNPPPPPDRPSNSEFWNDPNKALDARMAKALTRDEFEATAASIRPSLIYIAKKMVMDKYPDFHRVEAKVNEIMSKIPLFQHTDPAMWETVFIQARGFEHDRLAAEDRAAPPTAERVGPGGTPPQPNADLYKVTAPGVVDKSGQPKSAGRVADMLGITHDQYRAADKVLQGDGLLPLTIDNRRPK